MAGCVPGAGDRGGGIAGAISRGELRACACR